MRFRLTLTLTPFLLDRSAALFDSHQPGVYKWSVFNSHIDELKAMTRRSEEAIAAFEEVLFWRPGSVHLSVSLLIGWQMLLHYPNLIPATMALLLLFNLNRTYRNARHDRRHPIHKRPSFPQIVCSVLCDLLPKRQQHVLLGCVSEKLPPCLPKALSLPHA